MSMPVINYQDKLLEFKQSVSLEKRNPQLQKLGEQIENTYVSNPLAVPSPETVTNFEADAALSKDVHAFEPILGTNQLERKLLKAGIVLNEPMAHYLRHVDLLGHKAASEMAELPAFHFILQSKYESQFADYGECARNDSRSGPIRQVLGVSRETLR